MKARILALLLCLVPQMAGAQEVYSLRQCLDYAVENNDNLRKDRLGLETAIQSKREIVGSLLPQISASSGLTRNIQKTTFAMPNFVNSMMPEAMRDPNAAKYMIVTMGMDYTANWGASLAQQILNFSLFNAIDIAKASGEMAQIGVDMTTEDVISQTVVLYYGVQVLTYAIDQFDESLALMDKTLRMLEVNRDNGLMRSVDVDQVRVSKTNLETERFSLEQGLEVQKNLLKLQMGFPMERDINIAEIDLDGLEAQVFGAAGEGFDVARQLPFKMLRKQQDMLCLQYKSAVYETLPVVNLVANYSMNYMGDDFKGETFYKFPVSMVSLNLKMPIFTGMSKNAKIKKAKIEMEKAERDERALEQALTMAYSNASMQLDQSRRTIDSQKRNKALAQEVFRVTENNYNEGLSSLSDLLNATSSLIQSQMNYVNALNNCMKAYIDLRKAEGTITEINF